MKESDALLAAALPLGVFVVAISTCINVRISSMEIVHSLWCESNASPQSEPIRIQHPPSPIQLLRPSDACSTTPTVPRRIQDGMKKA